MPVVLPEWVLPAATLVMLVPLALSVYTWWRARCAWMGSTYALYALTVAVTVALDVATLVTGSVEPFVVDMLVVRPAAKLVIPIVTSRYWSIVATSDPAELLSRKRIGGDPPHVS